MQDKQHPDQTSALAGVEGPVIPARRAWLARGAVMATPVIASLASAPVHAAGVCVLPSGFISAATFLSRHPGAMLCTNRGPTFWRDSPSTITNAIFSTVFPGTALESPSIASQTLKQVLAGSYSNFAKFCVAAYLNALDGTAGFPLSASQAVSVWSHFRGGPLTSLIPSGWTEATALAWLGTLMDP